MYRFDVSNAQLLKYEEGVKEQARYENVAAGGKKKGRNTQIDMYTNLQ